MASELRNIHVLGVHRIEPSPGLFDETLAIQWGEGLSGENLARAEENVREHFAGLYLIEFQVDLPDAAIDWEEITQSIPGQPRSNWQVPYDEQLIDKRSGRWAFFFHYLDVNRELESPVGPLTLPQPTPRPRHLSEIRYETSRITDSYGDAEAAGCQGSFTTLPPQY